MINKLFPNEYLRLIITICLLVLILCIACESAWAADDPEQNIVNVIKGHVIERCPEFSKAGINVKLFNADKLLKELKRRNEKISFKVKGTPDNVKPVGNLIMPIEIKSEQFDRNVLLRVQIEVFKQIVVAARQINRGAAILIHDVTLEERDVAQLSKNYFSDVNKVVNLEARTIIPKSSTILEWMVREAPVVRRGEEVTIRVRARNLLVKAKGVAMGDGYIGDEIKVKRPDLKKNFQARIVTSNEVEVKLE